MPCLVWRHTKTYPGKAQPCQVPAGCPRECRARYRHCAQLGGWTIVALFARRISIDGVDMSAAHAFENAQVGKRAALCGATGKLHQPATLDMAAV
jgi:hypothetical protein